MLEIIKRLIIYCGLLLFCNINLYAHDVDINTNITEYKDRVCRELVHLTTTYATCYYLDEAIRTYEIMFEMCPERVNTTFQLGTMYLFKNDTEKAIEMMDREINSKTDEKYKKLYIEDKEKWLSKLDEIKEIDFDKLKKEAQQNRPDCRDNE